jgi:hypothetical protein
MSLKDCDGVQGVVYLSEIQTVEDLKELSAKQAKEILAMNR